MNERMNCERCGCPLTEDEVGVVDTCEYCIAEAEEELFGKGGKVGS